MKLIISHSKNSIPVVEATVVQKLNQGTCRKMGVIPACRQTGFSAGFPAYRQAGLLYFFSTKKVKKQVYKVIKATNNFSVP